jgi:hypothetical protein
VNSDMSPREEWRAPTLDIVRHEPRTERVAAVGPDVECSCLVPGHLLSAWEAVYRDYAAASDRVDGSNLRHRDVQARLAAQLAVTWRRLANAPGIDWCLAAAFSTAAEAMEWQARDWARHGRRSA